MKKQIPKAVILSLAKSGCFALFAALAASPCGADTQIFANTGVITISDSTQPFRIVPATPYPATINVSGFAPSDTIETVTVTLHNLRHGTPDDLDILLVGPGGQNVIIVSDAGGGFADPDVPITITLDDAAASEFPDNGPDVGSLASGTYKPGNFEGGAEVFPAPAPEPSAATTLAAFTGTGPNGDWRLYLVDDDVFDGGSIADGWSLTIVSRAPPLPGTFAGWAIGFGLSGAAAAADADPDLDGLPNGEDYILGGNPALPAASGRPSATAGGGNLLCTFLRDDGSETTDVALSVEAGTDLLTWPILFDVGPDTAASSPGVSIVENGSGPDRITVTIPQGPAARKFARLKVTISP